MKSDILRRVTYLGFFISCLDYGVVGVPLPQMEGFTLINPVISHGQVRRTTLLKVAVHHDAPYKLRNKYGGLHQNIYTSMLWGTILHPKMNFVSPMVQVCINLSMHPWGANLH